MLRKSLSVLLVAALVVLFTFCKKSESSTPTPTPQTPETPNIEPVNGHLPSVILPDVLYDSVSEYFTIYEGNNPPVLNKQYVSSPHRLIFSTNDFNPDSIQYFSDRYLAFVKTGNNLDFYGKQWNTELNKYDEEVQRNLKLVGDSTVFTCYYLTEGQPNGYYAMQSTIFSGIVSEEGLKDFKVTVILLETSGNPNLQEKNSFRILGDEDGLAVDSTWLDKKSNSFDLPIISDEAVFGLFKK